MPGLITHLIAGATLYLIGRYTFKSSFQGEEKKNERLLLLFICLLFSIIPDAFLGFYYVTNLIPRDTLIPYHNTTHLIITPIAIVGSLFLVIIDHKRKATWFLGVCAVVTHVIMDLFIQEHGIFF